MKLFKIFAVAAVAMIGLFALAPIAKAQEAGYSIHVDFKSRDIVECVSIPIGTIRNVKYLGDVNVNGLFAITNQTSLGLHFSKKWLVADNASIDFGPSVRTVKVDGTDRVNFRMGAAVTLNYRF